MIYYINPGCQYKNGKAEFQYRSILSIGVLSLAVIASDAAAEDYRLPWSPGLQVELTQDCNDSSYADHIGSGKNAWDL